MYARMVGLMVAGMAISAVAAADTLSKVAETGRFVIGYREDAPPFSYRTSKGEAAGYSVDLCRIIAENLKRTLKREDIAVEFAPVTATDRIDKVAAGDVDIECGSSTHTLSRRERVDFSFSTFVTGAEMVVGADSEIDELADIAGKRVGVLAGTTTETGLRATLANQKLDAEVQTFGEHKTGIEALKAGSIDAYFGDRVILLGVIDEVDGGDALKLSGRFYSYEPYALMLRRDDDNLRLVVDSVLADLYRSGDIWEVYSAHFGEAQPSELLVALFLLQSVPVR